MKGRLIIMIIKEKLRKVISYVVTLAMIVSVMAGLDFGVITAEATYYSEQKWYITTGDDGTIQSVNFQFKTSDTAAGTWYLYLWDKNDTSGTNGRPQILSSASKTTSDGSHSMTIDFEGSHGKEYLIGMVLKDSKWSTGNTGDSAYSDWPYLTSVCDMVDCDDDALAGTVYINGEPVSGSVSDSLKTEGITINFASAGGTTGTMDSVTLSAEAEIYTLPTPTFTADTNRVFYIWDVVKEDGTRVGTYPSNQNIMLSGDSKTYTATAYYGYTATITGDIDDDDAVFLSEMMGTGKQLLSPEFAEKDYLAEGNALIVKTTLSPAPQITATNATINLMNSSDEGDGTYSYIYAATNITGPVTATVTAAEGGEEEEEDTPTGATYTFSHAYDCQRAPAFPKKGDKVTLHGFIGPYINNSSDNSAITAGWSLVSDGKYNSSTHTKLTSLVNSLNNYGYSVDAADMEVYKLVRKDTNAVVAIGFIFTTMGSDGLLYISSNDYGYYICDKALTNTDTITVTADGDISDPAIPGGSTGEEEEVTYNVTLDCTNYTETKVELYTYDVVDGDWKNRDMTSTNGDTITVAETGIARVFVYGGEFTVTAEGATVSEIKNAGDEGYYCEITNFTNDTTVVVNAVTGEEEVTYNVTLDSSKYEGNVILITYDNGNKYREETNINGNTLKVQESGFVRVFGYGGAFTVTAEGATVGELIDAGEEGSYREITNFTNDTTVVVNAVISHEHSWSTEWTSNETHHWHECANAGCDIEAIADMDGYAEHTFGDWTITTPATPDADGEKTRKCDCGRTETAVVKFVPAADEDTGVLTEDTNAAENECNADILIEAEDIITDIGLEDDEIKAIENGEDISIYLDTKNADATVSATDKAATESALTDDMEIGMFLDINLFKKIGNNEAKNITSTLKPIRITFKVPDELIKNGRIFSIIRVHNGKTDILSCNFDAATKTASFETDKFSSYAIAYTDNITSDDGGNTGGNPVIPNIPVVTGAPTTTPVTTTTTTTSTTPAEDEEDVEDDEDVDEDNIDVDEDTDTTKPADDEEDEEDEEVEEDEAESNVESDDDTEDYDVDGDKSETDNDADSNPETGVAVGLAGVLVAGAAVLLFRKRK